MTNVLIIFPYDDILKNPVIISKTVFSSFLWSIGWNQRDGKESLKGPKWPETTTDIQGVSSFINFTCKMFIFRNIYRC